MLIGVFGPSNILSKIFGESTAGAIYSFGYTLLVGVIGNFIMGVFCSRLMINRFPASSRSVRNGCLEVRISNEKFDFDFYKNRKILFGISIGLMVIGLIFNFIRGTKMDIQFVGGAMIKYSVDGEVDTDEIASLVKEETGRDVSVALSKTFGTDANQVTLSFAGNEAVTLDEQQAIAQSLSDAYADRTFNVVESSSVDPTMGAKFFQKCLVCLLITFVILLVYIALRFKKIGGLSAGVTALIALVHDVLLVYFAFVIFGFSINDIFIAVILTILGYSLNDTIVIYDRIRENRKLSPTKSRMHCRLSSTRASIRQ